MKINLNKIVFDEHSGYNEGECGGKYCEIYIFHRQICADAQICRCWQHGGFLWMHWEKKNCIL